MFRNNQTNSGNVSLYGNRVRKGWDTYIVVSKMPKEGQKYGIENEILKPRGVYLEDGDTLKTSFFPIVDAAGNITTTDFEIKADDEVLDSKWENKEQFIIDPLTGFITFPYGAMLDGKEITISYNYKEVLGFCTGIDFTVDTTLESATAIGSRNPVGITIGTTDITGTVNQYYINRSLFNKASRLFGGRLVPFDIEIVASPKTKNPLVVKLSYVRFSSYSLDFTVDGIVSDNCDFSAENINVYYLK